jgi:hypothetical protein
LSANDVKGKGVVIEGTPVGISQDLMNKFSTAVDNLDEDTMPTMFCSKTVSSGSVSDKTPESAVPESAVEVKDPAPVRTTGQRKKSMARKLSPQMIQEDDEDENAPIKLLKRAVKIEKIG